jgi:hypothetical protein
MLLDSLRLAGGRKNGLMMPAMSLTSPRLHVRVKLKIISSEKQY